VDKGEIFGIIGHSGAGKSTLLRCVNLLEKPTSGTVEVGGVVLTGLGEKELQERRKKIGMIFQHFNLLSTATVRENIAFPLKIARYPRDVIRRRVDELLELVGLTEHGHKYPSRSVRRSEAACRHRPSARQRTGRPALRRGDIRA